MAGGLGDQCPAGVDAGTGQAAPIDSRRSTSIGPPRSRTLVKPRSSMRPAPAIRVTVSPAGGVMGPGEMVLIVEPTTSTLELC